MLRLALEERLSLTRPDLGSFEWHTGPGGGRGPRGQYTGPQGKGWVREQHYNNTQRGGHVGTHEGFYLRALGRKEDM